MERIQTIGNSCRAHIFRDMKAEICHRRDSLKSARRNHSPGIYCLVDTFAAGMVAVDTVAGMAADTVADTVVDSSDSIHMTL